VTPPRHRHPPVVDEEAASSGFLRYAVGRPLMLIAWGVALWGTFLGLRLVWIAAARGAGEAAVFLFDPFVYVPVLAAVVAWAAAVLAFRTALRSS
jgi:hypothetical protein